jgi:hypothetical protein
MDDDAAIERLTTILSETADRFLTEVATDDAGLVRRSAYMRLLGRELGDEGLAPLGDAGDGPV